MSLGVSWRAMVWNQPAPDRRPPGIVQVGSGACWARELFSPVLFGIIGQLGASKTLESAKFVKFLFTIQSLAWITAAIDVYEIMT
jgi:hypothetical protein